ncbi:MAG: type II toxin-antitoxin system VapC family toxin [Rhizobacter sp.]|nr:type II toxin-antitoxin system VapC family toxin [Chlorobiales bacterium]
MKKYVLDSYALIVFFKKQKGWEAVEELLFEASNSDQPLLMSVVNWGEVFYTRIVEVDLDAAEKAEQTIRSMPIALIDADMLLTREAAKYKSLGGVAYADCFAAALAKREKAILVTGDPEFKRIETTGDIKLKWL